MKSKNIPADIRIKSIKEAQNEINQIVEKLENKDADLENSLEQYERMLHLNHHIQDLFRQKSKEITKSTIKKTKKKN